VKSGGPRTFCEVFKFCPTSDQITLLELALFDPIMGVPGLPVGGLHENQLRAAQKVKVREEERTRNETPTADAKNGTQKCSRQPAITSTTPRARAYSEFTAAPGPLPSIYGRIL